MANYGYVLECPSCGMRDLNLLNYTGLMMLRSNLALFTMTCPNCSQKVSSMQQIPPELVEEVHRAALDVGAGMGRG